MEGSALLHTTNHKFPLHSSIKWKKILNSIYIITKQYGVLLQLNITVIHVSTPIIFKISEETLDNIFTILRNAYSGKRTKMWKAYKRRAVSRGWIALNATDGSKGSIILCYMERLISRIIQEKINQKLIQIKVKRMKYVASRKINKTHIYSRS